MQRVGMRGEPAEPFAYDWFAAKSADGSLPLRPGITAFQVPDPQDLRVRLRVHGELQQDESTADPGQPRHRPSGRTS
jgi:2-keto-4-pentenoate hydratase/2-oxohepta-3-ene-1,7-dioic acid hydratase in catechol pathway